MRTFKIDSDALKTILVGATISIALVAVIVAYATISGNADDGNFYDAVSNTSMASRNTGAPEDTSLALIGFEKAYKDAGLTDETQVNSMAAIKQYISLAYPKSKSMSYRDKTAAVDNNTLRYDTQLDNGVQFNMIITDNRDGSFDLIISDKNNEVFSYQSRKNMPKYENIKSLPQQYLPVTLETYEGIKFSFVYKEVEGGYFIYVNGCDKQEIYDEAKEVVDDWLRDRSYNPEEITINIPRMCDGGI